MALVALVVVVPVVVVPVVVVPVLLLLLLLVLDMAGQGKAGRGGAGWSRRLASALNELAGTHWAGKGLRMNTCMNTTAANRFTVTTILTPSVLGQPFFCTVMQGSKRNGASPSRFAAKRSQLSRDWP